MPETIPTCHYADRVILDEGVGRARIYAYPKYRVVDQTLVPTEVRWREAVAGYDWYADGGVHEVGLAADGTTTLIHDFGGKTHRLTMRLEAAGALVDGEVIGTRTADPVAWGLADEVFDGDWEKVKSS